MFKQEVKKLLKTLELYEDELQLKGIFKNETIYINTY